MRRKHFKMFNNEIFFYIIKQKEKFGTQTKETKQRNYTLVFNLTMNHKESTIHLFLL
jgi:outer membrane protein assembly factor BamE (lipoprotein component of BamABCDE complex)